jgi:hypothetical protein
LAFFELHFEPTLFWLLKGSLSVFFCPCWAILWFLAWQLPTGPVSTSFFIYVWPTPSDPI